MAEFSTVVTALLWGGLLLGIVAGTVGWAKKNPSLLVATAALLALAAIPGLLSGIGLIGGLLALGALVVARTLPSFYGVRRLARVLVVTLDAALIAWVAWGLLSGTAWNPSVVDYAIWGILAAMTLVAWWPTEPPVAEREKAAAVS